MKKRRVACNNFSLMGQCNTVRERRELAIYEMVSPALLQRDISTGTKGAGMHLHLMQIRSRCLRSARSGLRSRTVSPVPPIPPAASVGHSCSPSLPPARTSRAGSLSRRIEMLPDVTIHLLRDRKHRASFVGTLPLAGKLSQESDGRNSLWIVNF